MKGQISAVLGRLNVSKGLALAAALFGLLGIVPYLAVTQDQNEAEDLPQQPPLIGVVSSNQNPLQTALLRWYDANLTRPSEWDRRPMGLPLTVRTFGWRIGGATT